MISNWKRTIFTIWTGQSVSLLTSSVMQMSLIWYLTATTGSARILTFATFCGFFPQAILGSFAGVFIDRFPRKTILIVSDLFIALVSGMLALSAVGGEPPIPLILVALVLRSVGTSFHEPAAHSLTPLIVPPSHITQYAGYAQAFDSVCLLLSPALAALLNGRIPLHYILMLDVLGALVAVSILCVVQLPVSEAAQAERPPIRIWADTVEGVRVLKRYDGVLTLVVVGIVYSMIYSPVGSLYPHLTMNYFGGTTDHSALVEIVSSVGSLLGALLLGRFGAKLPKTIGMAGSMLFYGVGMFLTGCLPPSGYRIFLCIAFCVGVVIPFYHGINRAIYQLTIPQEYLGRAMAITQSTRRLGMPVGLLCGGVFADATGINVLYMVMGVLAVCLALYVAQMPALRQYYKK